MRGKSNRRGWGSWRNLWTSNEDHWNFGAVRNRFGSPYAKLSFHSWLILNFFSSEEDFHRLRVTFWRAHSCDVSSRQSCLWLCSRHDPCMASYPRNNWLNINRVETEDIRIFEEKGSREHSYWNYFPSGET